MKTFLSEQPSFRQQDLITISSFVSFARENSIDTSEPALEFLERVGLLLPTVRIDRGYVPFRKIFATFEGKNDWRYIIADDLSKFHYKKLDKQTYYSLGGISLAKPGCLDWHIDNNMIVYPAKLGWNKEYDVEASEYHYATDTENLGNSFEPLYMPYQIYILQYLQSLFNRYTISGLRYQKKDWKYIKLYMLKHFTPDLLQNVYTRVNNMYQFFTFYLDIQDIWQTMNKKHHEELRAVAEDKEELREKLNDIQHATNEEYIKAVQQTMQKHSFSIAMVTEWKNKMLTHGSFWNMPSKRKNIYLIKLSDIDLYHAEYTYKIVYVLNWVLKILGEKQFELITEVLRIKNRQLSCPYCDNTFSPRDIKQLTCGAEECQKANKNQRKREGRKSGYYKK